jgi:alpha-tubulin suppressor-like RCC1 family protein
MEPNLVPKLRGRSIKQVVASTWFSLAIVQYPPMLSAGYVYSWGSGYYGQLAQGTKSVVEQPEIVEYFVHCHLMVKLLAAGQNHCLAVTQEGELYSWGNNTFGALGRRIEERDVQFTPMPGHVPGFGALFGRIGRGFPRSISCGRDFSVVATFPYEGPDFLIATKLMEEAKIREQELLLTQNRDRQDNSRIGE